MIQLKRSISLAVFILLAALLFLSGCASMKLCESDADCKQLCPKDAICYCEAKLCKVKAPPLILDIKECKTDSDCPAPTFECTGAYSYCQKNKCMQGCKETIELNVSTNSKEYFQGEAIKISIKNSSAKTLYLEGCNSYIIEKEENGVWKEMQAQKMCIIASTIEISSGETLEFNYSSEKLKEGTYRITVPFSLSSVVPLAEFSASRSPSFSIKEKTVLAKITLQKNSFSLGETVSANFSSDSALLTKNYSWKLFKKKDNYWAQIIEEQEYYDCNKTTAYCGKITALENLWNGCIERTANEVLSWNWNQKSCSIDRITCKDDQNTSYKSWTCSTCASAEAGEYKLVFYYLKTDECSFKTDFDLNPNIKTAEAEFTIE